MCGRPTPGFAERPARSIESTVLDVARGEVFEALLRNRTEVATKVTPLVGHCPRCDVVSSYCKPPRGPLAECRRAGRSALPHAIQRLLLADPVIRFLERAALLRGA